MNKRQAAISRIPYLRDLSEVERESLAAASEVRHVGDGACVFSEGDPPEGIFLVLSGRVKLVRRTANGREQVLHEEGPGATLAEVPTFDGGDYLASAVAVGDVSVCLVPRSALLDSVGRNSASTAAVIQILAARVRAFAALAEDLSLRDVTSRLAGYLLRQLDGTDDSIELAGTRDQVAAHVGTVREQISRSLSSLERQGLIAVEGRRVRLLDRTRLEAVAAGDSTQLSDSG